MNREAKAQSRLQTGAPFVQSAARRGFVLFATLFAMVLFLSGARVFAAIGEGESPEFLLDLRLGKGAVGVGIGTGIMNSTFTLDLRGVSGPSLLGRSAESGLFAVNLLGAQGGLSVAGRVTRSDTGAAIGSASVTLGATSIFTDGAGNYSFPSVAVGTYPLIVSRSGFNSYNGTVLVSGGTSIRRDVSLVPAGGLRVTAITCPYPGFLHFLDGPNFNVTFTATVDWAGKTPSKVEFRTPKGVFDVATSGTTASRTFNLGSDFGPKGKLRVVAVAGDGSRSPEALADFIVMPAPLGEVGNIGMQVSHNLSGSGFKYNSELGFNMSFFEEAIGAGIIPEDIPVFGKEGVNLQFIPQMACEIGSDGMAAFKLKWSDFQTGELIEQEWGRNKNLKKIIELLEQKTKSGLVDQRRLPKSGVGGMELHWFPIAGGQFKFNRATEKWESVRFGAGLAGEFEVHRSWPFIVMAGPVPVPMYAKVRLEVGAEAQVQVVGLEPLALNGAFGLDPYVRGSLGAGVDQVLAVEGWVGGGADLNFQYPQEPSFTTSLYLNGGVTVYAFLWSWENELLYWTWPDSPAAAMRLMPPLEVKSREPKPVRRNYLGQKDYAKFHGKRKGWESAKHPKYEPPLLQPASGPLETTIFPQSEPDCSSSDTNLHLVWLYDQPSRGTNNRTLAVFSRYNGDEWTTPIPVADDGTADFHPQVLTFADGWSACAWENEQVVLPDTATFDAMKTNLEVAVAWFNGSTASWLPAVKLTTNGWLDRSPKLAGLSRSNVLMVWVENIASHLTGNETATNNLLFTRWNGTAWTAPQTFASLTNALVKYDLGYDGTNGNLVMSLDLQNNATNVNARELFRIPYQAGVWGALERLTADDLPDDNPLLARDPTGDAVMVWLKGEEVSGVTSFNMNNRQVVQTNLYTSNLGDAKLAQTADGKLALLWAEPSDFSSDLSAAFYDPLTQLWGQPKSMTDDPETERSLTAGFWGGNRLLAIYNRLLIGPTNNSGFTDLYVMEYNLGEDLALPQLNCLPLNPGPGDAATFEAVVRNLGDKPAANVPVAFYLGLPGAGGVEIGRLTMTGPLVPGQEATVPFGWTLPATSQPLSIHAVVDPDLATTDLARSNNIAGLDISLADTAVQSVTWSQIASNLLSITARIANQGVLTNPVVGVEFRLGATNGTLVYSQSLTNLAPGQAVDVAFLWNTTGVPAGSDLFVVLTGLSAASDFNAANNSFRLAVQQSAAPIALEMLGPVAAGDGSFQLWVVNEPGMSYRVETSTNLVDWEMLGGFFSTNAVMPVLDNSTVGLPRRFYRAVKE